jgi:hypothetical protein
MKKLLNNPLFVSALALVAVALVGVSLLGRKQATHSRPVATATGDVENENEDEWATPVDNDFDPDADPNEPRSIAEVLAALVIPEIVRDPLATAGVEVRETVATIIQTQNGPDILESVRLTAIWEQGSLLLLVINNRIHEVGDRIGRLTIESADLEGVWLKHWKGRDFLPFGGEFTLVTPAAPSANSTTASDES